jgi:hypothetical protein
MKDLPETLVTLYSTPNGTAVRFSDRQLAALQRAGIWPSLNYKFLYHAYSAPTHPDDHIANMLGDYHGKVHIGMLDPDYRDPDLPYIVTATHHGNAAFAPCETFREALKSASEMFLCDIATVSKCDFRPEFHRMAEECRIVLLVV